MGITRSSLFELKSKELILFILQTFVELLLCAVYHWGIKLKHSPCPQGVSSLAYKSNVKQLVELQSDRLGGGTRLGRGISPLKGRRNGECGPRLAAGRLQLALGMLE